MTSPPMNVSYLGHREIKIGKNTVYAVSLSISGPMLLEGNLEEVSCEVFVQKDQCESDRPEHLTRCAARRLKQLGIEAYDKAVLDARMPIQPSLG